MEYELLKVDRYWFHKPIFFETKDHVKLHVLVEGEEAQKWYDKAGEEDQQEAAKEASTQSIEDVK